MSDAGAGPDAQTPGLFEAFGVELEYMLVDRDTLDVRPIADRVLSAANGGELTDEVERGPAAWSNELVLHVLEFKTSAPAPSLAPLADLFHQQVVDANALAANLNARLMPTAMHPWMDPDTQTRLWPHGNAEIYGTFNRIFDCRGHGWSNLQSVHLNLPWRGDEQFGRLHAAIRLLLPILPALAASSPIVEGRAAPCCDYRMEVYRGNARAVPAVSGLVVPEPAFTTADYQRLILDRIYADMAPHDPAGILRYEWCNARGAIARFMRNTIEVRVLDVQEHPAADLAIVDLIVRVLREMVSERWCDLHRQQGFATESLARVFLATVQDAEQAVIADRDYLAALGMHRGEATVHEVWRSLAQQVTPTHAASAPALEVILHHGPLARRILRRLGGNVARPRLDTLYRELCDCLAENRPFLA
jgi:gamma-glutamyl:cysteine ligase YbdK (ATP-grasp superfamily)